LHDPGLAAGVALEVRTERDSARQGGNGMDFDEILAQILHLLQRDKRLSYRALKRRFALDDEYLKA